MSEIVHHVAFALAALALGAAALRVAGRVAPDGLERALVAVVLAVVAAIVTALALGLVGLGTNPVVLTAAAVAMWAAARALVPRPAVAASTELARWWGRLGAPLKLAVGALAGVFAAWLAWQLRFPSIGFDSAVYHYPDVAGWIANGRPGSQLELSYDIPYGNYPLTDEVGQTWGAAIARSYIPLALWNPAMLVVAGAATWLTLRNLRVSTAVTALATATLLATPLLGAPAQRAPERPAGAGLAGLLRRLCHRRGPAPRADGAGAAGRRPGDRDQGDRGARCPGRPGRRRLPRARPAAAPRRAGWRWASRVRSRWAGSGTCATSSSTDRRYGRSWTFPWGTPSPRFLGSVDQTFLSHPRATLEGRLGEYTSLLGGSWLMLAGSVLVLLAGALLPLREPRAAPRAGGFRAALHRGTFVIWSVSWGSGMQTSPELATPAGWSISALRYLLPGIALAILSVALATRFAGPARPPGHPAPRSGRPGVEHRRRRRASDRRGRHRFGLIAAGAVAGALWSRHRDRAPADGARRPAWLPSVRRPWPPRWCSARGHDAGGERLHRAFDRGRGSTQPVPEVVAWFLNRPGFEEEDYPVSIASRAVMSAFAGDRFQHPLELVPAKATAEPFGSWRGAGRWS